MTRNQLSALICASLTTVSFSSFCYAGLFDGIASAVSGSNAGTVKPDTPLTSCDGVETVAGTEADLQKSKDAAAKREVWCSQPGIMNPHPNAQNPQNAQCTSGLEELRQQRNGIQCYLQASQQAQQKAASEGDECSKNGYKDCYKGIKWGETITKAALLGLNCPNYYGPKVGIDKYPGDFVEWSSCDKFLFSTVGKARSELGIGSPNCPLITLDNKLVGFIYGKTEPSAAENYDQDQITYMLGKLKSKYGTNVQKSECQPNGMSWGIPVNSWDNSGGINIQTMQVNHTGTLEFIVRYVNIEALKHISDEVSKRLTKTQSDDEDKKLEKVGNGL